MNDLLGGHIDMIVLDVSVLLSHIRSDAIKALAVASALALGRLVRRADDR